MFQLQEACCEGSPDSSTDTTDEGFGEPTLNNEERQVALKLT